MKLQLTCQDQPSGSKRWQWFKLISISVWLHVYINSFQSNLLQISHRTAGASGFCTFWSETIIFVTDNPHFNSSQTQFILIRSGVSWVSGSNIWHLRPFRIWLHFPKPYSSSFSHKNNQNQLYWPSMFVHTRFLTAVCSCLVWGQTRHWWMCREQTRWL